MIAVVQRVKRATVTVADRVAGHIDVGLAALVAVEKDDGADEVNWMAEKLVRLRIFRSTDGDRHFDQDVTQIDGAGVLLVSNFTVAAATRKGRRPSLDAAASPEQGKKWFDQLVEAVRSFGVRVATGEFGADMLVSLDNDGPVTFIVQTEPKAPA
jgi:D-tyrosyl-tRNA(Tyr) deacylase